MHGYNLHDLLLFACAVACLIAHKFPSRTLLSTASSLHTHTHTLRAGVHGAHILADFTLDFTTPLEGTRTSLLFLHHPRVILPPATHEVTAVQPDARTVTLPPSGAQDACRRGKTRVG